MVLPKDVWAVIFEYDATFHRLFQDEVLPELRRMHTESLAEIFFYFFWDEKTTVRSVTCDETTFHFDTSLPPFRKYTVEIKNDSHVCITFRIHNHHTGMWCDYEL